LGEKLVRRILQNKRVLHAKLPSTDIKVQATPSSVAPLVFADREGRRFILRPKGALPASVQSLSLAVDRASAPPVLLRVPLPKELQVMLSTSASLKFVWTQACGHAHAQRRLLIRANQLAELLSNLGTTRYRMECHGLKPLCRPGTHTTLYGLADVLCLYFRTAGGTALPAPPLRNALEQVIVESIACSYGAEIRGKDLAGILGGASFCQSLIASGALTESKRTRRCAAFPLLSIERVVARLRRGWIPSEGLRSFK
jgi:hypothetical protein